MKKIRLACPCHFGLESVLKYELSGIGAENLSVTDGKISFDGDISAIAAANLRLACAERVLIELGSFRADTFDMLFDGTAALPIESFVSKDAAFPVRGRSLDSKLTSVPACQSIVKKALCRRMTSAYGVSHFEESGAAHQVQFIIHKNICTVYLDTSGDSLHKRGYRRRSNAAPISETLAAGIVDLARVYDDSIVCDPMCGSGTLIIEAAYKAMRIAPGLRRSFAAEKWRKMPKDIWAEERKKAFGEIKSDALFCGLGSDIDPKAVDLTLNNIRKAGVSDRIRISEKDIMKFSPPDGSVTICNPPYGERMLEIKAARELYKRLGDRLKPDGRHRAAVISPDEDFEAYFGKPADKKRKLYNGMIKCYLYMYFK